MDAHLAPGAVVPDLELPDHDGVPRTLTELAAGDPVVLSFHRGWWCPKDQTFLRGLVRLQEEAEVAYTRFVSVSVDAPEVSAAFRAGLGARWTFLCDVERRYQDDLDLLETTDTLHHPYLPTVATLYPDLRVHASYAGYWFWGRPTLEELRRDLRAVTRDVRGDWEVGP